MLFTRVVVSNETIALKKIHRGCYLNVNVSCLRFFPKILIPLYLFFFIVIEKTGVSVRVSHSFGFFHFFLCEITKISFLLFLFLRVLCFAFFIIFLGVWFGISHILRVFVFWCGEKWFHHCHKIQQRRRQVPCSRNSTANSRKRIRNRTHSP